MSLRRLVTSNGGQYYARDKSSNVTLLEERTPGLDEKTIILDIVKLIYVFKNNLPDQKVAIFALSSKLTPWKVIFNVQPLSALQFPGPLDPPPYHPLEISNSLCGGGMDIFGTTQFFVLVFTSLCYFQALVSSSLHDF